MNIGRTHLTQVQFDKLWTSIRHELTLLYNNNKCSASLIYNNIYIICTSTTHKYVEDLYWKIGDFLYEILRNNKYKIFSDNWIPEYINFYEKYLYFVKSINDLADYLNQYITSKSIYHFAFLLWERCILQSCKKYKQVNLGEYLVFHENLDEVKICLKSLRNILVDPEIPLLYYNERYEKFAFSAIIDKCNYFVANFKMQDVNDYLKAVSEFLKFERERRKKTFLRESWDKLDIIMEDLLIIKKKKWIKNEIFKILMQHELPVEILNTIRNSMSEYQKCTNTIKKDILSDKMEIISDNKEIISDKMEILIDNKEIISDSKELISGNCKTIKNLNNNINDNNINDNNRYDNNRDDNNINDNMLDKMPHFPLNDFYALFTKKIPSLFTYTTESLNKIKIITQNLENVNYGIELLDNVLDKYLTTQLQAYNHLLDKKIETLYIFYTLFNHVVKVGFHNTKNANFTLHLKLREVYNSLSPSLSTRLIKFTNTIVNGECVMEKKNLVLRKGFIDFYDRSEICNLNEEEGIDYWGENDSTTSSEIEIEEVAYSEIIPFADPKLLNSKDEPVVKKIYTARRNKSLPDLSKFTTFSYKDGALLRVFVHLYNLVDDKTDFYKKYLQELSKRVLLYDINYYKELELFSLLTCEDRDLKLKGEIMFSDMKSLINIESGITFLTDSAWNLEIDNVNLKLPDFLNNQIMKVEKKVRYAFEFSVVVFELNKKDFRVNVLQFLVCNLFNKYEFINKPLIRDETGLNNRLLESSIKSLLKAKFMYQINTNYYLNSDSTILNVIDYFIKEDIDESHEINQDMYYLCKVANVMKKYKKLSKEDIFKNVLNIHTDKFMFSEELFDKGIQGGIDKGIIEEKEGMYYYLP